MNTQISSAAELELRKHVERAVRPVHARSFRKMKMREELLAHLTGIFAEEIERSGDEEQAIATSRSRFDQPAEITAELDRSISNAERLGWAIERCEQGLDKVFSRSPGESLPRYLLRTALAIIASSIGPLVGVCGLMWSVGVRPDAGSMLLIPRLIPVIVVANWTALYAAYYVNSMQARGAYRWLLLIAQSGLWSLLLSAVMAWFWWSISVRAITVSFIAVQTAEIWAVVAAMLLLIALASDYTRRIRHTREAWTKLEIGE